MTLDSVWRRPSGVLFGQMYEDFWVEQRLFPPGCRVFCIASAGCTAIELSDSRHVVAVDVNRDQLAYAEAVAAGSTPRPGTAEKALSYSRYLTSAAGWTSRKLANFAEFDYCPAQLAFWREHLNTRRFRAGFDSFIALKLFALRKFAPKDSLPPAGLGPVMRSRIERTLARHPNRTNPFIRRLFLGELVSSSTSEERKSRNARCPIQFKLADAVEFLADGPPESFDAFSLSNITDGASPEFRKRLKQAVQHAAAPNALLVARSLAEPSTLVSADSAYSVASVAADDRSILWGSIYAGPAARFLAE